MPAADWDDYKERVRQATDIVSLAGRYVTLKRRRKTFSSCCPFHQERTPSFHIYPDRQTWRCYGACGEGGDVFSLYMKAESLDFTEALDRLGDAAGIRPPEGRRGGGEGADRARQKRERYLEMQRAAEAYFQERYLEAGGAHVRAYVERRGITPQTASDWAVGYAPDNRNGLLAHLEQKGYSNAQAAEVGLASQNAEGRIYDRFRNRLIFPIRDDQGRTVGFGGRALSDSSDIKYLNSPAHRMFDKSRLLYGLDRAKATLRAEGAAVVCEGYLDVAAAHQYGVTAAIATMGTALTTDHIRLLRGFADRIVLAFDGDKAGRAAGERAVGTVLTEGARVQVAVLPTGQDVADLCTGGQAEALRKLLADTPSGFQFLLEGLAHTHDLDSPQGKSAAAQSMMETVGRVTDTVVRQEYRRQVADFLLLPERTLDEYLKAAPVAPVVRGAESDNAAATPAAPPGPIVRAERALLEFLLLEGPWLERAIEAEVADRTVMAMLVDPEMRAIVAALAEAKGEGHRQPADAIVARLPAGSAKTLVVDALAAGERSVGHMTVEARFTKALDGLLVRYAAQARDRLEAEARAARRDGKDEAYKKAVQSFQDMNRFIHARRARAGAS